MSDQRSFSVVSLWEQGERNVYADAVFADTETGRFAVADGIGDTDAAAEAAHRAIGHLSEGEPAERMAELVLAESEPPPTAATTITLLTFSHDEFLLHHLGDSRCYLVRGTELRQLTTDHTLAAELIAAGRLRPQSDAADHYRHKLTRFLGDGGPPDTTRGEVALHDRFLLATDGLIAHLSPAMIIAALTRSAQPLDTLMLLARGQGSTDNKTGLLVHIMPPDRSEQDS